MGASATPEFRAWRPLPAVLGWRAAPLASLRMLSPASHRTSTSWTVIEAAARGDTACRERFVACYVPVVRAYLLARWRESSLRSCVEDAVQEVFVDCFREDGALGRVDPQHGGTFRSFLRGVTRLVARRFEVARVDAPLHDAEGLHDRERELGQVMDRAWAQALLRAALELQLERAQQRDVRTVRRVEILRARVLEEHPVREIAAAMELPRELVHREYARARREFLAAVKVTLGEHLGPSRTATDEDVRELLTLLE